MDKIGLGRYDILYRRQWMISEICGTKQDRDCRQTIMWWLPFNAREFFILGKYWERSPWIAEMTK